VAGADRGTQGRWAVLRHRIPLIRPEPPEPPEPTDLDPQPVHQE